MASMSSKAITRFSMLIFILAVKMEVLKNARNKRMNAIGYFVVEMLQKKK